MRRLSLAVLSAFAFVTLGGVVYFLLTAEPSCTPTPDEPKPAATASGSAEVSRDH